MILKSNLAYFIYCLIIFIKQINILISNLKNQQPHLSVWFFNPKLDKETVFINNLVYNLDGPFVHSAIQLPDGMSCSIHMNENIHLKKRTFSNIGYTGVQIPCSSTQLNKARENIFKQYNDNLSFSNCGMFGAHFGLDLCESDTTYCSKITNDALIYSEIFKENEVLSPSGLYFKILNLYGNNCTIIDRENEQNVIHPTCDENFKIGLFSKINEQNPQADKLSSNPIDWSGPGVLNLKQVRTPTRTGYVGSR